MVETKASITTEDLLRILCTSLHYDTTTKDWCIQHPAGKYVGLIKRRPSMRFNEIRFRKHGCVQHDTVENATARIEDELTQRLNIHPFVLPIGYTFKVVSVNTSANTFDVIVKVIVPS